MRNLNERSGKTANPIAYLRIVLPDLIAVFLLILLAHSTSRVFARQQDTQNPAAKKLGVPTEPALEGELRTAYVTVVKKDGTPLPDLKKEDFTLFENGVAHDIISFASTVETPVIAALLVDMSGSTGSDKTFETKMKMISMFAASAIRESDRAFVMVFGADSRIVIAPTNDSASLQQGLMLISRAERRGPTSLYDALISAAETLDKDNARRKIIVLLSDFEDNTSRNSLERVIPRLQETETAVYPLIDVYQNSSSQRAQKLAVTRALQVARESGGIQYTFDSAAGLKKLLEHIQLVLRDSYVLKYRSKLQEKKGKLFSINVKTQRKDVEVLTSRARK